MSNNHRKNSSHNSEAPELSNRIADETLDESMLEQDQRLTRYEGEVKRQKTESISQGMPDIGAEIELLETVEEVMASSNEADLYTELFELYDGDVSGKQAELQLSSQGYSIGDARKATNHMIDEGLLEIDSPGVSKPTEQGESVYQVLNTLK